jgi:hypothetical protein
MPEALTFRFTDTPYCALSEVTVEAIERSRGRPPSLLATQAQFQFSLGSQTRTRSSAH